MVASSANYPWINKGDQETTLNISRSERHFNAIYLADLCVKDKDGEWIDTPVAVFWQEKPKQKTHSNYFGLFFADGKLAICDARCVADTTWDAVQAKNGEIIFSRFRHDYRSSRDRSAMIDGGKSGYIRYNGTPLVLKVDGPDFVIDQRPSEEPPPEN